MVAPLTIELQPTAYSSRISKVEFHRFDAQSQFHSTQPTQPPIQSQSQSRCHATQPTQPQPQNQSEHIPTKVLHLEEYPMVNKAQTSSSSQVSEGNTGNKIMILPEGDGFDQHKLVVRTIASIIRTNLEEAKPSWKQLSIGQRNLWFNIFKKEAKGTDPSLVEFYFRTHRKKNDQSWVGPHAESVYDKFVKKKFELSSMSSKVISGEDIADSQPSKDQMPSDFDVWVDSVGKKKGRIFGLGSVGNALFTSSSQPLKLSANSEEVDILRNQIQELNDSLKRQELEKLSMRRELTQTKKQGSTGNTLLTSPSQPMKLSPNSEEIDELRNQIKALKESLQIQEQEKLEMKQELIQTKKQVFALMQHLGFVGSSTVPSSSPEHSSINEDNGSDTDKFVKKKFELSSMSSKVISGEDIADSQPSKDQMPSDFDVWVDSVGKKKGRIFGLGSVGNALFTSSSQPLKLSANSEEVDILRNQIQELNDSLKRQELEKLSMRRELTQTKKQGSTGNTLLTSPSQPMKLSPNSEEIDELRNQIKALKESLQIQEQEKLEMKQELIQTKKQVFALMQHLGFVGSSTVPSSSPEHSSINEDNGSDTVSDHIQ
ncbi:putative transposase [Vigna unguiculata]|uniref:Putative transposase n=2 Tax=Vigna unguiculata TaxID=3917 RepID=A0A4D6NG88_VIGUN|nr:putative transposase [Vigna unguiculata]